MASDGVSDEGEAPEPRPTRPLPAPPLRAPGGTYGSHALGVGYDVSSMDEGARPFGSPRNYPRRYRRRRRGVLSLLVFVVAAIVIFAINHHSSSSSSLPSIDTADQPPAEHLALTLGQPATLQIVIGYTHGFQPTYGTVTLTPTAVTQPATMAGASDVNATVKLTVCAGSQAFTPGVIFAGGTLTLASVDNPDILIQIGDNSTSPTLDAPLQPGQCATGLQGYDVSGGKVTQISFGSSVGTQDATWTVGAAGDTSP